MDLGTGDGRAVLQRAAADPRSLVIGVDAAADAMAEASRRASRRGPANALFIAGGVEQLPSTALAAAADLVTITMPWGSLLSGVLGRDPAALAGIAASLAHGGRVESLLSVVPSDALDGLASLDDGEVEAIREAWRTHGLDLTSMTRATPADVAASGSSWARRLGPDRPVWRLAGVRLG